MRVPARRKSSKYPKTLRRIIRRRAQALLRSALSVILREEELAMSIMERI